MAQTRRTGSILIAEENPLFRRGLKALFASDPGFNVVGETSDATQTLQQIRELRPRAMVIGADLLLQYGNSRLATSIRQAMPELLILVLANENSEESVAAAVTCGAKGLLLKSAKPADFVAALRNILLQEDGTNWPGLLPDFQALAEHTSPERNTVLTAREQEVVRLLAEGKTVRTVAHDLSLSAKTIEAHKLNLMRKLDIHDRVSLVAYANRNGMVTTAARAH